MHLVYIDDSKDGKEICFSALIIPAERWLAAFNQLLEMRRKMKRQAGVYINKELHATDWVGGRGNVAPQVITREKRVKIFNWVLDEITQLPEIAILNAYGRRSNEDELFKRLIQRIENNVRKQSSHAIILSDEGKNYDFLLRKMRRHNYIPSALGAWADGASSKNIPAEHVLEDLIYRDSKRRFFIQAADFCAFSLLRFETPTPRAKALGFDQSFKRLDPVLLKAAFRADPKKLGIIRV
jgi:hypothetical protein